MQSLTRTSRAAAAVAALAAVALLLAAARAEAGPTGTHGCLTNLQAAKALQSEDAKNLSPDPGDDPATCTYFPINPPSTVPKLALLIISIYSPGLPGWKAMAKAACELDDAACSYASKLTDEHDPLRNDPLRYMRLLYAALDKSGDGVVGTLHGFLPGSTPAFFWNKENPERQGSYVLMYVARQKRFVSVYCSRAPENLYPHYWFEHCALTAARLVYINLVI